MKTSLVSTTAPSPDLQKLGVTSAEDLIVYTARVSSPQNQLNIETAPRLLAYLIKHRHWSPFEMVDMTVEITTSRAIAAQILRHRSFSFQEFSQRYADASGLGFEEVSPRRQDTKNKQNSTDDLSDESKLLFRKMQDGLNDLATTYYRAALGHGIAKESARFLLPLSTSTKLYMKGSCRSWVHYLEARLDPSTQLEHRHVAEGIQTIFRQVFPNVAQALEAMP